MNFASARSIKTFIRPKRFEKLIYSLESPDQDWYHLFDNSAAAGHFSLLMENQMLSSQTKKKADGYFSKLKKKMDTLSGDFTRETQNILSRTLRLYKQSFRAVSHTPYSSWFEVEKFPDHGIVIFKQTESHDRKRLPGFQIDKSMVFKYPYADDNEDKEGSDEYSSGNDRTETRNGF